MPKGGARAHSGPPPDPNALRRDRDSGEWLVLPAAGRPEKAPEWPLENQTDREAAIWEIEWARPQAVMWEQNSQELEVAMYVRSFATAEQMNATVAARTLVRQQQEALGLSLPGLHRNKWRIEGEPLPPPTPKPRGKKGKAKTPRSARSRFKVVDGGAAH